ncbi:hypothetical protein [Plantactinospora endophytica]|uniref:Uncharacterized protein n=1 Tax=Plantactinospora endophytica TaxID=673535 RepID=A0ABQ4EES6_9ACTN|nr:hypothetical protein [Plantactinospora endophytica]GIG93231.1 hypothetical protein Pen02_81670 [Plantactinospora endophytica]
MLLSLRNLLILLGVILLCWWVAAANSPEEWVAASEKRTTIRTEANPEGVEAVPVWFEDGTVMLGMWLGPGERDLSYYVPVENQVYRIPDADKPAMVADAETDYPYSTLDHYSFFAYFAVPALAIILGLLGYAAYRDKKRWMEAQDKARRARGAYMAYKEYLDTKAAWQRHREIALRRMEGRVNANVAFFLGLTGVQVGDIGRSLARQINRLHVDRAVSIGLEFRTVNEIGDVVKDMRSTLARARSTLQQIDADDVRREKIEELAQLVENQLRFDIVSPAEYFGPEGDKTRAKVLAQILSRALGGVFPEPIIDVSVTSDSDARIQVSCVVKREQLSLYLHEGVRKEGKGPAYPGIGIDWDISFFLGNERLAREQSHTTPDASFKSGLGGDAIYRMMAATAFAALGRRMLREFGLISEANMNLVEISSAAADQLFDEFVEFFSDSSHSIGFGMDPGQVKEFFESRSREATLALAGVVAAYEQDLSRAVSELVASAEGMASAAAASAGSAFEQ